MNLLSRVQIIRNLKKIFNPKAVFGAVLGVYVFTILFGFFGISPKKAQADSGDTEYGKWYTTDEIVLKTTIQVIGPDGAPKSQPFVRVGADSGQFKVKITVHLEKPDNLTFAPTQKIGNPDRDGVRGPNRLLNHTFYENIWPLEGMGSAYGIGGVKQSDKDLVTCTWKNVRRLWRVWESPQEIEQCSSKGGKESNNDEMSGTYKPSDGLYNNTFDFGKKELEALTFKPAPGTGKTYALVVWSNLRVNTGDTTLTEAIVAGGVVTVPSPLVVKFGQSVYGVTAKAVSKLADIKAGKTSVAQVVSDIVKTVPDLPPAEARAIAEETLDSMLRLSRNQTLTTEILESTTTRTVQKLVEKGLTSEKAQIVATEHLGQLASQIQGGAKLLDASGHIVQSAAVKAGVEKGAASAGARIAGKIFAKLGSKWIPVVGTVWTAVDIALYLDTFSSESLSLYRGNAHKVWVEVYATQAEADAAKDEPIPQEIADEIAKEPSAKTGSPAQPNEAMGTIARFISDIFVTISHLLITLTYSIFSNLVSPMLEGVLSIHTYTDEFVNVIYPGWEVLRNVANIYFIIAIIAIALGTLFRVESYKTRHLLVQLIMAALTVNFSLVIGQAVLGVADTVQNQFLPNNVQVIRELGRDLMPNQIKDIIIQSKFAEGSLFATASASLFFLSLAFGSFLVFAAILVFLVIRIVMLWILLMLSPLAYAAGVLPATANLRGQWWGNFLKYAFFTPIMAFFLNMAAIIAVNYEYVFRDINTDIASKAEWGGFATLVFAVASNALLLVFLFAAINIAQKMGIFGADVMDKIFKAGVFAPFAVTAAGAGGVVGLAGWGLKTAGGALLRGYSGLMGTKAFEAVQAEVKAKQAKTALQAGLLSKQKKLDELRADPNADRAEIAKLEKDIGDLDKDMHKAEHEEHRQARRKRNFGLALFLNPIAVKKGWEARKQILEARAYKPAEGFVHDMLNRYMPTEWGIFHKGRHGIGRITDHGFVDKLGVIRDEAKHLEALSINRNFAVYAMDNAAETGSWEERMGQALLISKQNQQDDVGNLVNKDAGFTYTGYNDLMYLRKKVWSTMSPAAREIMAVQLLEEQESSGRGRSMFFNEGRNATVDDLTYMKDKKGFNQGMERVSIDLRETQDDESIALANQIDQMVAQGKGVYDIVDKDFNPKQGMEKVHEAIVSSDIARILASKQTRGNIRKWLTGMNPAEVREQTVDGWEKYTTLGLMKISKAPKALLQVYLRRMHEGEVRTAVYGGAMVDPKTKEIRMPRSREELISSGVAEGTAEYQSEIDQYKQWQRVTKARPELSASIYTFFHHPDLTGRVMDEVGAGKWGIDPANPAGGVRIMNSDGTFGAQIDLNSLRGGAPTIQGGQYP